MKTSNSYKQYKAANSILLFIVSIFFGYNLYQEIYHPEKSQLLLCAILVALTSVMIQKYGIKTDEKNKI
ncbi:hypothetical protein [Chryseobacterium sp. c4a]|uniref:hypothetical protein n=1 Tax=Chryseobacterium sp. c4a TaxID=1573582 RepID=UPI0013593F03|nr:hypothetical protein [Chryseobacterium sp. c4a]